MIRSYAAPPLYLNLADCLQMSDNIPAASLGDLQHLVGAEGIERDVEDSGETFGVTDTDRAADSEVAEDAAVEVLQHAPAALVMQRDSAAPVAAPGIQIVLTGVPTFPVDGGVANPLEDTSAGTVTMRSADESVAGNGATVGNAPNSVGPAAPTVSVQGRRSPRTPLPVTRNKKRAASSSASFVTIRTYTARAAHPRI